MKVREHLQEILAPAHMRDGDKVVDLRNERGNGSGLPGLARHSVLRDSGRSVHTHVI